MKKTYGKRSARSIDSSNKKRKKKSTATEDHNMGNLSLLPSEIIFDIFSRLPFESVLQCKGVCRTLTSIIIDHAFQNMYIEKQHSPMDIDLMKGGFIIDCITLQRERPRPSLVLHHVDFLGHTNKVKKNRSDHTIVGSSNGLICSVFDHSYLKTPPSSLAFDILVMNPFTGEHVNLPRVCMDTSYPIMWGFGFHPSSNEYKVVGFNLRNVVQAVKVYTLGISNGVWRDVGSFELEPVPGFSLCRNRCVAYGTLLDGCLHWLRPDSVKPSILMFNLGDEKLRRNRSSSFIYNYNYRNYELGTLGGNLCLTAQCGATTMTTIWVMEVDRYGWRQRFNLHWPFYVYQHYTPIALSKTGKILLFSMPIGYGPAVVASYDPKTKMLQHIRNVGDADGKLDKLGRPILNFRAIPHSMSSVSLKALGETNASML